MLKSKRVAAYIRVSTAEQAMEGYSIDEQIDRLQKYSEAMGWNIIKQHVDPGYSGSNMQRPALQNLIANVKDYDVVLVYRLDRLSRSQKDTMYLIEDVFLKNNIAFVSMCESFDTSTPFGRASVGLLATFSQLERENIRDRMSMGKVGRVKKGYWGGSNRAPIGYDYINGELIINDYEALQIRELFQIAAYGIPKEQYTIRNMAKYLSSKYSNKYGSWSDGSGIPYTIHNQVYIGMVKHNKDHYKGLHIPIIDTELFEKANRRLDSYLSTFCEHVRYTKYMLSSITYCGLCGRPYYRRNSQVKHNGKTKEYGYYSCRGRREEDKCDSPIFKQEELEQAVIEQIAQLQYRDWSVCSKVDDTESLIKKINQIDSRQERLIDLYSVGSISKAQIEDKIKELNIERDKVKALLASLNILRSDEIIHMSSKISNSDYSTKCDIVLSLVEKVIIVNESIEIHWRF